MSGNLKRIIELYRRIFLAKMLETIKIFCYLTRAICEDAKGEEVNAYRYMLCRLKQMTRIVLTMAR
jgi:hypothetical protein